MVNRDQAGDWIVYRDHTSSDCRTYASGGSAPVSTDFAKLQGAGRLLYSSLLVGPALPLDAGLPESPNSRIEGMSAGYHEAVLQSILTEADAQYGAMLKRLAE